MLNQRESSQTKRRLTIIGLTLPLFLASIPISGIHGQTLRIQRNYAATISNWGATSLALLDGGEKLIVGTQAGSVMILRTIDLGVERQSSFANGGVSFLGVVGRSGFVVMQSIQGNLSFIRLDSLIEASNPAASSLRVGALALSPSGLSAALAMRDCGVVNIIDFRNQCCRLLYSLQTNRSMRKLKSPVFSPSGDGLLCVGDDKLIEWRWNPDAMWDSSSASFREIEFSFPLDIISINSDGRLLIAASNDGNLQFYDRFEGRSLGYGKAFGGVNVLRFTPDDRYVAVGFQTGEVQFYSVEAGQGGDIKPIHTPINHSDGITELIFTPDGATMFTTSMDGRAAKWRLEGINPRSAQITLLPWERETTPILIPTEGPVVCFTNPRFDENNFLKVNRLDHILLEGRVIAQTILQSLQIGEEFITLENDTFVCSRPLVLGANRIRVRARDVNGGLFDDMYIIQNDAREVDNRPPRVSIIEPHFNPQNIFRTNKRRVLIRGSIDDESGIEGAWLNGNPVFLDPVGCFTCEMPLTRGDNHLEIHAKDRAAKKTPNDTLCSYTISAQLEPEFIGPLITIYEPWEAPSSGHGIKRKEYNTIARIRGNIADEDGVASAKAIIRNPCIRNCASGTGETEIPIQIGQAGGFSVMIPLNLGENEVKIDAMDQRGNIETKDVAVFVRIDTSRMVIGDYYALLIAIDYYNPERSGRLSLSYPVAVSRRLARILEQRYRFCRIDTLFNEAVSSQSIYQKLEWYAKNLGETDNLLIYYTGHGDRDESGIEGYWVTCHSRLGTRACDISYNVLLNFADRRRIKAKHLLLIADNCYAKLFAGDRSQPERRLVENNLEWWERLMSIPSRRAILSGNDEVVPDHSILSEALCNFLEQNSTTHLATESLFTSIHTQVLITGKPPPRYNTISEGDQGGEFIFILK